MAEIIIKFHSRFIIINQLFVRIQIYLQYYTIVQLYFQIQIFKMLMSDEVAQKYESYTNTRTFKTDTLDEPVMDTIRRDFMEIYQKITTTMSGKGNYDKIKQQWDLWGPLIITLVTASMAAFGTQGQIDEAFTSIFICMWLGPLIITINASLLGVQVAIIQTLCLIIYCSTPIMLLSIAVFIMNLLVHSFLINLVLGGTAMYFVLQRNRDLFNSMISGDKQFLTLYPVLLFYTFMCIFIAMT